MDENKTKQQLIEELRHLRKHMNSAPLPSHPQDWFGVLAEHLPCIAIMGYATTGDIFAWNKESENLLGYSSLDAVGKRLTDLIVPAKFEHIFHTAIEKAKNVTRSGEFMPAGELPLLNKEGKQVPVHVRHIAIVDGGGEPLLFCIAFNMHGCRQIESDLLNTKKLESIGVLAGGIAHDFNNLLLVILGNLNMAQLKLSEEDPVFRHFEEAEKACIRAKDLTQKFITFSSGGSNLKSSIQIVDLVENAVGIILSGSNVIGKFRMPRDLWKVDVDEDQMRQALAGIIVNAKEAMPGGGCLHVSAENIEIADSTPHAPEGKYVKMVFQDEGVGISNEYIDRIFDPYFSTKSRDVSKGTGFGLAIAHSVIKGHNGQIKVDSFAGKGTTVTILIPASIQAPALSHAAPAHISAGKKRVLIMDDEEMLCDLLKSMLNHLGFEAGVALNGEQALEMYSEALEQGRDWDVLILDLTVKGGMGGKETLQKLLYLNPSVRAIVSSGHSADPIMSEYWNHGFRGMLSKPFALDQLRTTLQRVLSDGF